MEKDKDKTDIAYVLCPFQTSLMSTDCEHLHHSSHHDQFLHNDEFVMITACSTNIKTTFFKY